MATRDNLLISTLHGTAMRAAVERWSLTGTIAELRALAGGRNDLLAQVAGTTAGSWMASPETHVGHELIAAGLLIAAGVRLDYSEPDRWAREGYERGLKSRGPLHGPGLGH